MGRARSLLGSLVFLVLAPGTVAGVVPWLLTDWKGRDVPLTVQVIGIACAGAGAAALLWSFARFALEGRGTPAPVAPTRELVVGGLYRYVRNPMYLAVAAAILGQALLLGRPVLLAWLAIFLVAVVSFVRGYEEPTLRRTFGAEYEAYRRDVPGWWPRLRPRLEQEAEVERGR